MGKVLKLKNHSRVARQRLKSHDDSAELGTNSKAKLLIFTGVRYSRLESHSNIAHSGRMDSPSAAENS